MRIEILEREIKRDHLEVSELEFAWLVSICDKHPKIWENLKKTLEIAEKYTKNDLNLTLIKEKDDFLEQQTQEEMDKIEDEIDEIERSETKIAKKQAKDEIATILGLKDIS